MSCVLIGVVALLIPPVHTDTRNRSRRTPTHLPTSNNFQQLHSRIQMPGPWVPFIARHQMYATGPLQRICAPFGRARVKSLILAACWCRCEASVQGTSGPTNDRMPEFRSPEKLMRTLRSAGALDVTFLIRRNWPHKLL